MASRSLRIARRIFGRSCGLSVLETVREDINGRVEIVSATVSGKAGGVGRDMDIAAKAFSSSSPSPDEAQNFM